MRNILLLGASGSIGSQTLDIILNNPDRFTLKGISIGHQVNKLPLIIECLPSRRKRLFKTKRVISKYKVLFWG